MFCLPGEGAAISGQTTYLDSQEYHSKTPGLTQHHSNWAPIQIHLFFHHLKKNERFKGFDKNSQFNVFDR